MSEDEIPEIPEPDYNAPDPDFHTSVRAFERYGCILSDADRDDMIAQIREARGFFMYRTHRASSALWMVYWPTLKRVVPVLYNRKRHTIVTILPMQFQNTDKAKSDRSKFLERMKELVTDPNAAKVPDETV